MSNQHAPALNCDKLTVLDFASIRKLYVEELENASTGNGEDFRICESADTRHISLVQKTGRAGGEGARIRAIKAGVGLKVNPYEKVVEFRTNLMNKQGLNHKLLDTVSQTFKQIEGGDGIQIEDNDDAIKVSSIPRSINARGSDGGELVNSRGEVKRISILGMGYKNEHDLLTISSPEISAGSGVKVTKLTHGYKVSLSRNLEGYSGSKGISLLNCGAYKLKNLHFDSNTFHVEEHESHFDISKKDFIKQINPPLGGISLLHDNAIKYLKAGKNCRILERDGGITIDQVKINIVDELLNCIKTSSLEISRTSDVPNKLLIENPHADPNTNVGSGVPISQGSKIKSIRGKGFCEITSEGDTIDIACKFPMKNASNSSEMIKLLNSNKEIKCLKADDNIVLKDSNDCITISCPYLFSSNWYQVAEQTSRGLQFSYLKPGHGIDITRHGPGIEIAAKICASCPCVDNSISLISPSNEVKTIKGSDSVKVTDHGSFLTLDTNEIGQWNIRGFPIVDKKSNKVKTLRTTSEFIDIKSDNNSITINNTFSLASKGTSGISLHDGNYLKKLEFGQGVEVIEKEGTIIVHASDLHRRVDELENTVLSLVTKYEKLGFIDWLSDNVSQLKRE